MSLTPQVRVLAAAGCAAMVALMGGYMLLGRGQSSSSAAVPTIKPLHPVKKHVTKTVAPKTKRRNRSARRLRSCGAAEGL